MKPPKTAFEAIVMMNKFPKWDNELYPHTSDYILQLFKAELAPTEVYWAVARYFMLGNRAERQALADKIAQLYDCNVMSTMPIPEAPRWRDVPEANQ